jgi:tetratricopeptide (TPR) repeat protein
MFSSGVIRLGAAAALGLSVAGCGQIGFLQARLALREAHALYGGQDYRAAAAAYEEAIAACEAGGECTNPAVTNAYFFLGNSYDNLYRPARRGEAANDELLTKAVANYRKSAQVEQDPKIKQLALEYLVAAYGPDKLNDPSESETLLKQMIELVPNDERNYFALGNIYEQNGDYEAAEAVFLKAKEMRPNEPTVYTTLAGFYNRQGDFEKTIAALQERATREPENPEAHHIIATYYWDKVYRDFRLTDADKRNLIQQGIQAEDRAIKLKGDYYEALTYKNLLLRSQALVERDPARQQALIREADQLRDRALEIRKQQQAGSTPAAGAAGQ